MPLELKLNLDDNKNYTLLGYLDKLTCF